MDEAVYEFTYYMEFSQMFGDWKDEKLCCTLILIGTIAGCSNIASDYAVAKMREGLELEVMTITSIRKLDGR